ncbi:hypothetical protein AALO_G00297310 [Alosa alosa]|uniref:Dehydrogenase/reductase SDR family member 4 n=1 Tax=Alosa alosa TaxID=278164 RepID=A0AAV6FDM0_9TELE|nr:hypothetical protein AALO_G00297310 [Alosa alosa]
MCTGVSVSRAGLCLAFNVRRVRVVYLCSINALVACTLKVKGAQPNPETVRYPGIDRLERGYAKVFDQVPADEPCQCLSKNHVTQQLSRKNSHSNCIHRWNRSGCSRGLGKNIQVTGTTCNAGKSEEREKLVQLTVEQCGGVDILVNNAAVNPFFGNIMDSTDAVWDKILDINVKAAFLMTKLVAPHMEKRGGGSVVFVSSVAGYQPMQGLGPYSVSKTALLGLTRALAPELAHSNIRVNCVAPGIIKTRFSSALWQSEDLVDEFKKQLAIKRLGEPKDIGGVIAFLCSDDAAYITGETITVTGGMGCRL